MPIGNHTLSKAERRALKEKGQKPQKILKGLRKFKEAYLTYDKKRDEPYLALFKKDRAY